MWHRPERAGTCRSDAWSFSAGASHPPHEETAFHDPRISLCFNRFGHAFSTAAYERGASGSGPEFWRGWRTLTSGSADSELDLLAEAIVEEVKARGPFRSLAEFVNRSPNGTADQQRKGALQAALDLTINNTKSGNVEGRRIRRVFGALRLLHR